MKERIIGNYFILAGVLVLLVYGAFAIYQNNQANQNTLQLGASSDTATCAVMKDKPCKGAPESAASTLDRVYKEALALAKTGYQKCQDSQLTESLNNNIACHNSGCFFDFKLKDDIPGRVSYCIKYDRSGATRYEGDQFTFTPTGQIVLKNGAKGTPVPGAGATALFWKCWGEYSFDNDIYSCTSEPVPKTPVKPGAGTTAQSSGN